MSKENKTSDKPQNGNDFIADVSNRTLNTLESIDADTKLMIDRVSQKGYVMNDNDNREMKMRIDALKSVLYGV